VSPLILALALVQGAWALHDAPAPGAVSTLATYPTESACAHWAGWLRAHGYPRTFCTNVLTSSPDGGLTS
jgi:hypothetical protein